MTARVLIVEDEALLAEALEDMLGREGHEICGKVTTGEAAIDVARATQPDVVLMDVKLAGNLDGIDAAETIRRERACRVVFLTAYANPLVEDRIRRAVPGAQVLGKPASPGEIKSAVRGAG
jgi:DNA-binding response OmpR family regulator